MAYICYYALGINNQIILLILILPWSMHKYDVAVIGCGIAGMATAMRLQAAGKSTLILEAHGQPGGCAGFFTKKGFSFDVGATTLVDFAPEGIGGQFLASVGLEMIASEVLDYQLWLPGKTLHLYRDINKWHKERAEKLGNTSAHQAFWALMDKLARVFWQASRNGIKLPLQSAKDVLNAAKAIGIRNLSLASFLNYTVADVLKKYGLENDRELKAVLSMLVEDTVNSTLDEAPLINAALGITIRGAGLYRANGGMKAFWMHLVNHYKNSGGKLLAGHKVEQLSNFDGEYCLHTRKGNFYARQVVSAIPAENTMAIVSSDIKSVLGGYVKRDRNSYESAVVVFLGVPEAEVTCQELTHHQVFVDYNAPLGNGNNMFISVSAPGDINSAPQGCRSVMISTHCKVADWANLTAEEYQCKKEIIGKHLLNLARRVYPELGSNAVVYEVGTPHTYEKFTGRVNGTVGGVRQSLSNSNFKAMPHDIGIKNFRMVGDTTWPGLGTVACILGSKIVAQQLLNN
jgi:C-3',4' desaturase CrtD